MTSALPSRLATRYVVPLREGGSLPAVVETDDDGLWVVKFRGAGQGARALVAELVVGLLARAVGLPLPDLAVVEVDESFGRSERDPEIQDILRASRGPNVGIRYLDGAFNFHPGAAGDVVTESFATDLVWFDAFVTNPDRTPRNPNLLLWSERLWLIDHGAALYAHHDWERVDPRTAFPAIRDHVLLTRTGDLAAADDRLAALLTPDVVTGVLEAVPESLLLDPIAGAEYGSAARARERYRDWLAHRLAPPRSFADEAAAAAARRRSTPPERLSSRR